SGEVWAAGVGSSEALLERVCPVAVSTGFAPATASAKFGRSVTWRFPSSTRHLRDLSGLALFDAGSRPAGSSFSFGFVGAGTYTVTETISGTTGKIKVGLTVNPASGPPGTVFTAVLGSASPPAGYVYDVSVLPPTGP